MSAVCLLALTCSYEVLLRSAPHLAPEWYKQTQPLHGVDMLVPGVLDRTPVGGVPLPMHYASYAGSPWLDLVVMGMVDPAAPRPDAGYRVDMSADALGLPNASEPERVDALLVGDSFTVMASDREPPGGLQAQLERETGLRFYNLSVAGIGPLREAWLLDEIGLAKQPRLVVWLFYAGNDAYDANAVRAYEEAGLTTYAHLFPDYQRPWLFSIDVLRGFWRRAAWPGWPRLLGVARAQGGPATAGPLPGLRMRSDASGSQRTWFLPLSVRYLARDADQWRLDRGWQIAQDVIAGARDRVEAAGARFVVVYLPTKPEIYLPFVEQDAEQIHRMATFDLDGAHPEAQPPLRPRDLSPEDFLRQAHAHRESLRGLFEAYCAARSLDCLIASEPLEDLARAGRAAYLSADSHWNRDGQRAVGVALLERLRAR